MSSFSVLITYKKKETTACSVDFSRLTQRDPRSYLHWAQPAPWSIHGDWDPPRTYHEKMVASWWFNGGFMGFYDDLPSGKQT